MKSPRLIFLANRYGERLQKIPFSKRVQVGQLCAHCANLKDSCRLPSHEGWRFGLEFAFPDRELLKILDFLSFEEMRVVGICIENQKRAIAREAA